MNSFYDVDVFPHLSGRSLDTFRMFVSFLDLVCCRVSFKMSVNLLEHERIKTIIIGIATFALMNSFNVRNTAATGAVYFKT
jgi:hypothetical protein